MGLSAINQYVATGNTARTPVEDYVDYVRRTSWASPVTTWSYNIARHVDSSVHLFEKWGLPIWTDENGKYVMRAVGSS
jgi:adenylylsulfate reductase subunit A